MDQPTIRILIVDDSAFMRYTLANRLGKIPDFMVVGTARDGEEALDLIPRFEPDVITLDVEMPRMDGLIALREIMGRHPRPVIMVSNLTREGARETIQALTWGAVDFVCKPDSKANIDTILSVIAAKIRRAATARVYCLPKGDSPDYGQPTRSNKHTRPLREQDRVVVIGTSTGGPRALNTVLASLPGELAAAVLIVQHMPAGFTRSLAERLDNISALNVKEAAPGDALVTGRCLVAPGGFHMILDTNGLIILNQNPNVHGVRPAVDVTMAAVTKRYGSSTVGVILTGMGKDGANGAALIRDAGGSVIAEDESTCVVWGMPRSVVEAGLANFVAPLPEVAATIARVVNSNICKV